MLFCCSCLHLHPPSSSSLLSVGGSMATSVGKRRSVYWGRTVVRTEPIWSERARTTRETILSASSETGYTLTIYTATHWPHGYTLQLHWISSVVVWHMCYAWLLIYCLFVFFCLSSWLPVNCNWNIAAFEYLHSCFSCLNCLFPWFIFTSVTILRLNTTGLSGRTIWLPWTTRNFSRTFSNWWKWVFIITA